MARTLDDMGRPKKREPTEPLRLPRSVVKRIRILAIHFEMDPGEYFLKTFSSTLEREEKRMAAEVAKEREGER